jgi:hypothetical protein
MNLVKPISKIALTASIMLAMSLAVSCSDSKDETPQSSSSGYVPYSSDFVGSFNSREDEKKLCGTELYDPNDVAFICTNGVLEQKCPTQNKYFDPKKEFCRTIEDVRGNSKDTVVTLCANFWDYDPMTEFCGKVNNQAGIVTPKCGDGIYDLSTHACVNGKILPNQCKDGSFDTSKFFCTEDGVQVALCEGKEYTLPAENCKDGKLVTQCGTSTQYAGADQFCDMDNKNFPAGVVADKCGTAKAEYATETQMCNTAGSVVPFCLTGSSPYVKMEVPAGLFCQDKEDGTNSGTILTKCGADPATAVAYSVSKQCTGNVVYDKCKTGRDPTIYATLTDPAQQFCQDIGNGLTSVKLKCGAATYNRDEYCDAATTTVKKGCVTSADIIDEVGAGEFCQPLQNGFSRIQTLCGVAEYSSTEVCDGAGNVVNRCGGKETTPHVTKAEADAKTHACCEDAKITLATQFCQAQPNGKGEAMPLCATVSGDISYLFTQECTIDDKVVARCPASISNPDKRPDALLSVNRTPAPDDTQICFDGRIGPKCGSAGSYNFDVQFCTQINTIRDKCGNVAKGYVSGAANISGAGTYNTNEHFCRKDFTPTDSSYVILPLCEAEKLTYTADKFCQDRSSGVTAIVSKCGNGGPAYYASNFADPSSTAPHNGEYNTTQFCRFVGEKWTIYNKCDGTAEWNPSNQRCVSGVVQNSCGAGFFDPATSFCENGISAPRCNSGTYNIATQFCGNDGTDDVVKIRCGGGTVTQANVAIAGWYNVQTQFCSNFTLNGSAGLTVLNRCGAAASALTVQSEAQGAGSYNASTNFCGSNVVVTPRCGESTVNQYGSQGAGSFDNNSFYCYSSNTIADRCRTGADTENAVPGTSICCRKGAEGQKMLEDGTEFCYEGLGDVINYKVGKYCAGVGAAKRYNPARFGCNGESILSTSSDAVIIGNLVWKNTSNTRVKWIDLNDVCGAGWSFATATEWSALSTVPVTQLLSLSAGGTNLYGFNAALEGYYNGVEMTDISSKDYFWNSSTNDDYDNANHTELSGSGISNNYSSMSINYNELSVRCVRNVTTSDIHTSTP